MPYENSITRSWLVSPITMSFTLSGITVVAYKLGAGSVAFAPQSEEFNYVDAPLQLDLTNTTAQPVIPNSVLFTLGGKQFLDRNGTLYTDLDHVTGSGSVAGSVEYESGKVQVSDWASNTPGIAVQAALTTYGEWLAVAASFRTTGSPLRPASFFVQVTAADGELLTGTSDVDGNITGDFTAGTVDATSGVVNVGWGELVTAAGNEAEPWYDADDVVGGMIWKPRDVVPATIRYSAVVLANLPLNADILGLDPVRLPSDGRVPIFRPADVVVIHNTKSFALPNPVVADAVYDVGRDGLAALWLVDSTGKKVPTDQFTADLVTGEVTMASSLVLTGLTQPFSARHRREEMNLLTDVQINGKVSLASPLVRDYGADTYMSSALLYGDVAARVTNVFDQATWSGVWSNTLSGSQATAQYNSIDHPIEVLNEGAINQRWRLHFTTTTAFQLIGEDLGVIATGTITADFGPVDPLTGKTFFVIRAAGFGSGWSVGNNLRFNTIGASPQAWIARTTLAGATLDGDSFDMQLRGDADA